MRITQDLSKNLKKTRSGSKKGLKKNPKHTFVDIGKSETCAKFQQKILNSRVVGARQSFQIFKQNTWFFGNNGILPKFFCGICIT